MQTIRRWWRTTFGKIFVILAGGVSSTVFCCIGLLVLVAVVNPPAPAARSTVAARTAVVQQVADTIADESRANAPTAAPTTPPATATSLPTAPPATATPLPTAPPATATSLPTSAPTAPPAPPQLGDVLQDGSWRITMTTMHRADRLKSEQAHGQFVILYGTAENQTDKMMFLSKGDFELVTGAGVAPIAMERTATWTAADIAGGYEQTPARFFGMSVEAGTTMPLIMVFDVPTNTEALTLHVVPVKQQVTLPGLETVALLATPTPEPTSAPTATPTSTTPTVVMPSPTPVPQVQITQAINMRAGPSTAFAIKQTVQPGTSAELLSVRNEDGTAWYEVRVNGDTGWMSGTVVDVAREQANALPVNTERFVPPTAVPVRQPAAQPAAPAPSGGRVGAICRDGSRSSATGRGACSHHGGVAQWLYP